MGLTPGARRYSGGGSVNVSDTAYGAGWDGVGTVSPSQNAVYDKINALGTAQVDDTAFGTAWNGVTDKAPSQNAVYDMAGLLVSDVAYGTAWNGNGTAAPSKNALYDKIETLGSAQVSNAEYDSGWNGVTDVAPSKNVLYDKLSAMVGTTAYGTAWSGVDIVAPSQGALYTKLETMGTAAISDAAYGTAWNSGTTTAPTQNAVYDKIEALSLGAGVRPVMKVVAAYNASASEIAQSDYQCNGTTDASTLVSIYGSVGALGGGIIQLTSGTFVIPGSTHIHLAAGMDNIILQGQGMNTVVQKGSTSITETSVFYKSSGVTINNLTFRDFKIDLQNPGTTCCPFIWHATSTSSTAETDGMVLDRLYVDCGSSHNGWNYLRHVKNLQISDCIFVGQKFQIDGQLYSGAVGSIDDNSIVSENILVEGNRFINSWNDYDFAIGNIFRHFKIVNNHFDGGYNAIDTCISTHGIIANNTIKNMSQHGIYIEAPRFVTVDNNTVEGGGSCLYGIVDSQETSGSNRWGDDDAGFCKISNNTVRDIGFDGIWIRGAGTIDITDNIIYRTARHGICAEGVVITYSGTPGTYYCDNLKISGNRIYQFGTSEANARGIMLNQSDSTTIENNWIDAASGSGAAQAIMLYGTKGCSDAFIKGNRLMNATHPYQIDGSASSRVVIVGNWWDTCTGDGVDNGTGSIIGGNLNHDGSMQAWPT